MKINFAALILALLITVSGSSAQAQEGTYLLEKQGGAYAKIALQLTGNRVKSDVFAWWNNQSYRSGGFFGHGVKKGNKVALSAKGDDCKVALTTVQKQSLDAVFKDCMADNLPEDFSGRYKLISKAVPGTYTVTAPKTYFYKDKTQVTKTAKFLIKGDQVDVSVDNIFKDGWIHAEYENKKGKTTDGFMRVDDFRMITK